MNADQLLAPRTLPAKTSRRRASAGARAHDMIEAVDRQRLRSELVPERLLRKTRRGDNEIYVVNHHNAPATLLEVGRLREITFRAAGGGTGRSMDIDAFDTQDRCYDQLIVWDPRAEEIIGGYRFIRCATILGSAAIPLSTSRYFDFSARFIHDYLPKTIELGRSWVQPAYQPRVDRRKGLFALDNLWDGLGAVVALNPDVEYFFGKVTLFPGFRAPCRDVLLYFIGHYFPDREQLMFPRIPVEARSDVKRFAKRLDGLDFREGFKVLTQYVRRFGESIPPLFNLYMNLSPNMKSFGTASNPDFGSVAETGILVSIPDIYPAKKARYVQPMLDARENLLRSAVPGACPERALAKSGDGAERPVLRRCGSSEASREPAKGEAARAGPPKDRPSPSAMDGMAVR